VLLWAGVSGLLLCNVSMSTAGLSIRDLQFSTNPDGASGFAGQVVDTTGGIVIHKFEGGRPRLTLYDPASPDGWGGIFVKDLSGSDAFGAVSVGDWISLENVVVEEFRGNTQLTFDDGPNTFTIESAGNLLPEAFGIDVLELTNTGAGTGEKYEAMYVELENVTVGMLGLGKAGDNYELADAEGNVCWGADYLNVDAGGPYHPHIFSGNRLDSLSGIVEQYTQAEPPWDYYQIVTTQAADVVPEPATAVLLLAGTLIMMNRRVRRK